MKRSKGNCVALLAGSLAALFVLGPMRLEAAGVLYFTDLGNPEPSDGFVRRVNTDGTDLQAILDVGSGLRGVAVDAAAGKIYWTDVDNDVIERASLDGTGREALVTTGLGSPTSLTLDLVAGSMYWGDDELDRIARAPLAGGDPESLVSTNFSDSIALHVAQDQMFWASRSGGMERRQIWRATLNGANAEGLTVRFDPPLHLTIDTRGDRIYWVDGERGLRRSNLDGTGREDLFDFNETPGGIAVDPCEGKVYWGLETEPNRMKIVRANLDGTGVEDVIDGLGMITQITFAREQGTILVPCDYQTIQEAIDAAADGDAVIISQGVYSGPGNRNISFRGKAITVSSTNPDDPGVVANTIVNGSFADRGFQFVSGETPKSILTGLTICCGTQSRGAGVLCSESSPTISKCVISDNFGETGGGLFVMDGAPLLVDCTFEFNFATNGGAISATSDSMMIESCVFVFNGAESKNQSGDGGAIRFTGGAHSLVNCVFEDNFAFTSGGGIFASGAQLNVVDCSFDGNGAIKGDGGAIRGGSVVLTGCSFIANGAGFNGGAMLSRGSASDCMFVDNAAGFFGGAVTGGNWDLTNCDFSGNTAFAGGALSAFGPTVVSGCDFAGNSAERGGGIYNVGHIYGLGDLSGSDEFVNLGTVHAGRPDPGFEIGILNITMAFTQDSPDDPFADSGRTIIQLGGEAPGVDHDVINFQSTFEPRGELVVALVGEFSKSPPKTGEVFEIGSFGPRTDTFSLFRSPDFGDDRFLRLRYPASGVAQGGGTLMVAVELSGDLIGFGAPNTAELNGRPTAVEVGDFDSQSENGVDLAVTARADLKGDPGNVFVLLNRGVNEMGEWDGFMVELQQPVGGEPASVALGNFDGKNGLDVAVANAADDTVTVLLNDGPNGELSFTRLMPDVPVGANPRSIASADFDDDSDFDLAVANTDDGTVSILDNDGDAGFEERILQTRELPIDVDPSDLDNDKDIDLVVLKTELAGEQEIPVPAISVLVNRGDGTFEQEAFYSVGGAASTIAVGDLDNDTFVDVVSANIEEDSVSILLNAGDNTYPGAVNEPLGGTPISLAVADLDLDSDLDVIAVVDTGESPRLVRLLENRLDGGEQLSFGMPEDIDPGPGTDPELVTAGDVNTDGLADAIIIGVPAQGAAPEAGGPAGGLVSGRVNTSCPVDLDRNNEVDFGDLLLLLSAWGPCPDPCPPFCNADIDANCTVDFSDLLSLLSNWGPCGS